VGDRASAGDPTRASDLPLSPAPAPLPGPSDDGQPALPSGSGQGSQGAGASGAAGGAVVADATRASQLPALTTTAGSPDGDDDLPSSPVHDTDSSPD